METNKSLMSASESSSTAAPSAPDILLDEAPVDMRRSNINWEQTDISEYEGLYAVLIDNVLTPAECAALVEAAEATTNGVWEEALINVGRGRQERRVDSRSSARIIWDSPEIVARLWRRVAPLLPELAIINGSSPLVRLQKNRPPRKEIRMTRFYLSLNSRPFSILHVLNLKADLVIRRLNERMRFLKYGAGDYFRREQSLLDSMIKSLNFKNPSALRRHIYHARSRGDLLLHSTPLSQQLLILFHNPRFVVVAINLGRTHQHYNDGDANVRFGTITRRRHNVPFLEHATKLRRPSETRSSPHLSTSWSTSLRCRRPCRNETYHAYGYHV